jgi:hypothetical protein
MRGTVNNLKAGKQLADFACQKFSGTQDQKDDGNADRISIVRSVLFGNDGEEMIHDMALEDAGMKSIAN